MGADRAAAGATPLIAMASGADRPRDARRAFAPLSLFAWSATAGLLLWLAPAPPSAPASDPESEAARQRMVEWAVRDARRWQGEHGDVVVPWDGAAGHLAIVIDDVGRELHLFERLLALRYRLTFSVLPGAIFAPGVQARLRQDQRRPREILLHLPMEPLDPAWMARGAESREEFLRVADPPPQLLAKLDRACKRVPTAVGINNHMGSRLTADASAMAAIMPRLRERGLYFLDSRTTADTRAEQAARAAGVPAAARQFFLDHDAQKPAIEGALREAAARARLAPTIVIAHPSQAVLEVLTAELPTLAREGVGVYPLGEILARVSAKSAPG